MKLSAFQLRLAILCLFIPIGLVSTANGFVLTPKVKQTPEVIEAYRVCARFTHMLGEDLDFARAYEATFSRNPARRRAIAIAEGEFGDLDFKGIDDQLLVKAYKLRMQIFYLTLPLAGPDSEEEATLFFPPSIKEILNRKTPKDVQSFPSYVTQLDQDVIHFRGHLDRLAAGYAAVARRMREFKSEALNGKFEPPTTHRVEPRHGYLYSTVLNEKQQYYELDGLIVAREEGRMRIIGLRLFNRLF